MGSIRQIKRNGSKQVQVNKNVYNRGFSDGARQQRENDIQSMISILTSLETADGIGSKTAEKVREFFLKELGQL